MSDIIDQAFATALESGNPYAIAGTSIAESFKLILPEIGPGRREANIIVPIQHQLENLLTAVNAVYPMASIDRLYVLRDAVQRGWDQFKNWVLSQQWTDGRAAQQAVDTNKDPYLTVAATIRNINTRIASGGGAPAAGAPSEDNGGLLMLGAAAFAAWKLLG